MALRYPRIKAEDAVFVEKFINEQYVADNGVTLYNSPAVDNGITLDGTDQYAELSDEKRYSFGDSLTDKPFSIEALINMTDATSFVIASKGVNNVDAEWLFYVASTDKIYFQCHDESVADCRIARAYNTALTGYEGKVIHVAATYDGSGTEAGLKIYLNGARVDDTSVGASQGSYVAMEKQGHAVWLGRYSTTYADGKILYCKIYDKELTTGEIDDISSNITFTEPTPENSELWLPLRTHYDDGANEVTTNLGNINTDQILWGDGSTITTYPTLLEKNGIFFDGGDYLKCNNTSDFNWDGASSFTVGALLKMPKNASFLAIFNKHTNTDPHGAGVGWSLHKHSTAGIRCYIRLNDSYRPLISAPNASIQDNQWHFVALVIDINTGYGTIWVDGEPGTPVDISGGGDISNAQNFQIGAVIGPAGFYDGYMKFPFFMRQALSETQLKWLQEKMFRELNL